MAAAAKPKSFLESIQKGNHMENLNKVPEDEIHFVAPFDEPANFIEYNKSNAEYGDFWVGPKSATHKAHHEFLKSCNIKCVISLSNAPVEEKFMLKDISYHYFEAVDESDFEISKLFAPIHKLMDEHIENGKNVLVHCNMGVSRSGTIAVAYLMKTLHISAKDAWELARKSRGAIRPNEGFMKQLRQFEAACLAQKDAVEKGQNEEDDAKMN